MRKATLTRSLSTDDGTFGRFVTESGFVCFTAELPWRGNRRGVSCVPPGTYRCTWRTSRRFGACYHVEEVPGRTHILIHAANFPSQLRGCIAPGTGIEVLKGKRGVVNSRRALHALEDEMKREPFELTIV